MQRFNFTLAEIHDKPNNESFTGLLFSCDDWDFLSISERLTVNISDFIDVSASILCTVAGAVALIKAKKL